MLLDINAPPKHSTPDKAAPQLPGICAPTPFPDTAGLPLHLLEPQPEVPTPWKTAVEFVVAALLLTVFLPVILLTAALVRVTSRGPAFYLQTRVGKGGRLFRIYKLRTMYHDIEKVSGARWSAAGDPRVTFLGRFLRRTHLDELPQLFNVLKGEMSLVGPRPERPEFVSVLEREIARYRERLTVRPGVTGLAQVYLPPDTDLSSVRRKLTYDLAYTQRMNPWLDLRLMLVTGLRVLGLPLSALAWVFRLPDPQDIERPTPSAARSVEPLTGPVL